MQVLRSGWRHRKVGRIGGKAEAVGALPIIDLGSTALGPNKLTYVLSKCEFTVLILDGTRNKLETVFQSLRGPMVAIANVEIAI